MILSLVILASGCVSNSSNSEGSEMTYAEAEEKSTTISYSNLLQYPERHRGTFIEKEGRIAQVFDGGLLLHTNLAMYDSVNRWKGGLMWVDRQNNYSMYHKEGYLKVFGDYRGTKTYEGENGEYATVPRMGTRFVTDAVEVEIEATADPKVPREESKVVSVGLPYGASKPINVGKICVYQKCSFDTNKSTFRLKTNSTHQVRVTDSKYGNHTANITVGRATNNAVITVGNYHQPPDKILETYISYQPLAYDLLSSEIRVEGDNNGAENKESHRKRLESTFQESEYYWLAKNVETDIKSKTNNTAKVMASVKFVDNGQIVGEYNRTYGLIKEKDGWKLEKTINPYALNNGTIDSDTTSSTREPVYPSN